MKKYYAMNGTQQIDVENMDNDENVGPSGTLARLRTGNDRYASGRLLHPNQSPERRMELLGGQRPFAVVLGCSDSRVPPEIIFDAGIGDIFTIRVAGNVPDDIVIGSIEYAVTHLGTRLVVVLGHSGCGAVTATVNGGVPRGRIGAIADAIMPAVETAREMTGAVLELAIRLNVERTVDVLKKTGPVLKDYGEQGTIEILGAIYDWNTGAVKFMV